MPRPTIKSAAKALIEERGPLTLEEITAEMVVLGRTHAQNPLASVTQALAYQDDLVEGRGGTWYSLSKQVEGMVFTVALTALERDNEIVLMREDLGLVGPFVPEGRYPYRRDRHTSGVHRDGFREIFGLPHPDDRFIGPDEDHYWVEDPDWRVRDHVGQEVVDQLLAFLDELGMVREDDDEALIELLEEMSRTPVIHGPAGWLPKLRSREVLGLEIRDGAVHAFAVDKKAMKGMHLETAVLRVGAIAHQILDEDAGLGAPAVSLETLLEIIATEAPDVFHRPLPPLGAMLERAGFEVEDGLVGLPGAAWDDIRWALDPNPESAWGYEPGDAVN